MTHHERSAYTGTTKKLLVAVDIGTTFTAVSFSILQPREVPQFNEVRRVTLLDRQLDLTYIHRSFVGQSRYT
jgi:hypothetical protein